jgi:hypothetical protein
MSEIERKPFIDIEDATSAFHRTKSNLSVEKTNSIESTRNMSIKSEDINWGKILKKINSHDRV